MRASLPTDGIVAGRAILSLKAHLTKVIQGPIVTDRNQIGVAADEPGQEAGKTALDRTDSLGKEHHLFPHNDAKSDDGKIIKETEMARYVLEQAAAARSEQVRPCHGPQDGGKIKASDALYVVEGTG